MDSGAPRSIQSAHSILGAQAGGGRGSAVDHPRTFIALLPQALMRTCTGQGARTSCHKPARRRLDIIPKIPSPARAVLEERGRPGGLCLEEADGEEEERSKWER